MLELEGALDVTRLEEALRQVVSRHEILRTAFPRRAGMTLPFQVIADDRVPQLEAVDLSHLSREAQEARRDELFEQEKTRSFAFEQGHLLRTVLVQLSAQHHILMLALPALCADPSTLGNLAGELARGYAAVAPASEVMQYVDVVEWQNELLDADETRIAREYWRDRARKLNFAALLAPALPFEKQAEEKEAFSPGVVGVSIPSEAQAKLEVAARKFDVSSADFLLACWYALLWRVTGQQDVVVATGCDGRRYEELATACGLFAKPLPLELHAESRASFSEFLAQVKGASSEVSKWQDGFSWRQEEWSQLGTGFFPLGFAFEAWPAAQEAAGLQVRMLRQYVCLDRFRLKLVGRTLNGSLSAELHYDPAGFDRDSIERLAGHFSVLLASALEAPQTPVSELAILSAAERSRMLVEWNQTAADFPQLCLQQWFEQQAARTPQAPAVQFGEQALSYAELNTRANQLAHALRRAGVGPDSLVGLLLERSLDLMVALLGILKAGGAYVPLNPDTPKARLAQQLAGAQAVVTCDKLRPQLLPFDGPVVALDADRQALAREAPDNPVCTTTPDHLVYVLYTSGSTGVPKGVAVRHRNLVNYTQFMVRKLDLQTSPGLHFATVSTIAADLGNTCIYPALVSGGCLHVISYEVATDSARFADYLARHPIDVLKIVPSHLGALLSAAEGRSLLPRRHLVMGGETLKPELLQRIRQAGAPCRVLNHYGPTETTVGSLTFDLSEYDQVRGWAESSVPIGRPLANTRVYVLDERRQPVPLGTPGELYIAGAGVAQGYWRQPELTAERFLADPFVSQPGENQDKDKDKDKESEEKMYRTGDRVRWLPNGAVEFLGRADDQVKLRGFRIELGEIEAVLAEHPGVRQAVVLAREADNGEKRLVAYVVAATSPAPASELLQQHLAEKLPDYMVPAFFVLLDKLPLNANGKVDRKALPAPEAAAGAQKEYVAPRTAVEEVLAGMWGELLKLERIGMHDDLFKLGAHSLLATQVVSRLRRTFQVEVPLRALFETPTIAGLAEKIEAVQREAEGVPVPPLVAVARDRHLPLSFAQQRLWFFSQLEPGSPFYNVPRALRLRGWLNLAALEQSINQIVERHEVLRTAFATVNDEPVQVIAACLRLQVPVVDLRHLPESEREREAQNRANQESQQPFDLSRGPLLRPGLLRLADDDHVLLLTMHHIVSDAWSANLMLQELAALYTANLEGKVSPLAPLAVQYADYAVWQRNWLQGEVLEKQLGYWRRQLEGVPALLGLPTDRARLAVQSFRGAKHTGVLSQELTAQLHHLSQQEGATLFMTLLAGFQALLGRYTGQDEVVVGTDVANRTREETEKLIGFFINLLPLRGDLRGNPTFRELLQRVREAALGAYAHQEVPFEKLVEEMRLERSSSYNPLVQVLFVMQNTPRGRLQLPGLEASGFGMRLERSKFDLAVFLVETEKGLVGHWVYATDLFDSATIERMAGHYQTLLTSILAQPEARLSLLEFLTEEEKQQRSQEKKERKESKLKKLKTVELKAVSLASPVAAPEGSDGA
jgi:amino acid adenylation domain-containing protein